MTKIARSTAMTDAEATFYGSVDTAIEPTRQLALKAAGSQAAATAADIAYHRAVVQAAGNAPGLGGASRAALRALGTGGV